MEELEASSQYPAVWLDLPFLGFDPDYVKRCQPFWRGRH